MHLSILLAGMMVALIFSKRSQKLGAKEYAIAVLIALIQMAITAQKLLTMEMPPLY